MNQSQKYPAHKKLKFITLSDISEKYLQQLEVEFNQAQQQNLALVKELVEAAEYFNYRAELADKVKANYNETITTYLFRFRKLAEAYKKAEAAIKEAK